jgi:diketogulonate reductase-like aldo/keto reductase
LGHVMSDSKVAARCYRDMTVANVRESGGADHVQVAFLESARFHKLSKQHPTYTKTLNLLREAQASGRVLSIGVASLDSDLIEDVRERNEGDPALSE